MEESTFGSFCTQMFRSSLSVMPSISMVITATPPFASRARRKLQILTPRRLISSVTAAIVPGASRCRTISVGYWPVISTAMPLTRVIRIFPPPTDAPCTLTVWPRRSVNVISAVLGCASSSTISPNVTASPALFASVRLSRRRMSSG